MIYYQRLKGEIILKFLSRIMIYLIGILFLALGGVLTIKSYLGATPVSLLPLSISRITNLQLGTAAFLIFTLYVLIQILLLKKDFKPVQLLQILFGVLFGQIMNFFNNLIQINLDSMTMRIFLSFLGFILIAIGIVLTITPKIVPVAPDGIVQAIAIKSKLDFGKAKVYFDFAVFILAILLLFINDKSLEGVGIGTLLSAIFVGRIVAVVNTYCKKPLEKLMFDSL